MWNCSPRLILTLTILCGFLTGCVARHSTIWPVTNGSHEELPQPQARLLLLGDDRIVSLTAAHWLQQRGLDVVLKSRVHRLLHTQHTHPLLMSMDAADLAELGKRAGAQWVVVAESDYETIGDMRAGAHHHGEGDVLPTLFSASVRIRGLATATTAVEWKGQAEFLFLGLVSTHRWDEAFHSLTCQALATAWGFRPPGQHEIDSVAMCNPEPHRPIPPGTTPTLDYASR